MGSQNIEKLRSVICKATVTLNIEWKKESEGPAKAEFKKSLLGEPCPAWEPVEVKSTQTGITQEVWSYPFCILVL